MGCVATAIEQLLSYYRYPDALLDSIPGWETENYSLVTVPSGSKIDWDDVADLSLWCGMIVQMKYSPSASASGLWKAEERLMAASVVFEWVQSVLVLAGVVSLVHQKLDPPRLFLVTIRD